MKSEEYKVDITIHAGEVAIVDDLIAACHDAGYALNIDLLSDIPGLDDLLLAGNSDNPVSPSLPSVLLKPVGNAGLLHETQQLPQDRLLYGLVGDADDMADKPPH